MGRRRHRFAIPVSARPPRRAAAHVARTPQTLLDARRLWHHLQVSKEEQEAAQSTEPDVSPREVAEAIKEIKIRFGNVD